jgi:hypothetical protein
LSAVFSLCEFPNSAILSGGGVTTLGFDWDVQAEALHRQFQVKKQVLEVKSKQSVQDKYGNAAKPVDEQAAALLLGQSERYVEYNAQA